MQYDRTLLVADPRRCEPKKYVIAVMSCLVCTDLHVCVWTACEMTMYLSSSSSSGEGSIASGTCGSSKASRSSMHVMSCICITIGKVTCGAAATLHHSSGSNSGGYPAPTSSCQCATRSNSMTRATEAQMLTLGAQLTDSTSSRQGCIPSDSQHTI